MRFDDVPGRPRGRRRAMMLVCVPAALLLARGLATGCDVCAVYTATEMGQRRSGFRVGLFEQFSHFGTLREDGHEVANPDREQIDSSITQLLFGYNFGPRWGVQLNLPLITRQYRRREGPVVVDDDESGVGDLALLAHVLVASTVTERSVFRFSVLGGLELPTGSTDRLAEELDEGHTHAEALRIRPARAVPQHSEEEPHEGGHGGGAQRVSGIHGHDLALGSGSVDGIVGGQVFWSWQRLFVTAGVQYAIRTEGDFDYQYANELTWQGGPGVFALLEHDYALGVQAAVAGETRGKDTLDGEPADDTGITALYVGPGFHFTWGTSLTADLIADLPAVQNNTALQIVPDYRLRGGVTWRF